MYSPLGMGNPYFQLYFHRTYSPHLIMRKNKSSNSKQISNLTSQISQLALVVKQKSKKTKKRSRRSSLYRSLNTDDPNIKYRIALIDPFSPHATGAKCTVFNYKNTVTAVVRWKGVMRTTASGNTSVMFQPNPCFYGWGNVNSSGPFNSMGNYMGPMVQVQGNSTKGMNGALVDAINQVDPSLSAQMSSFRVVGGGVRIKSILSTSVAQAISIAVPVLVQNTDLRYQDINGGPSSSPNAQYTNTAAGYWMPGGSGELFAQTACSGQPLNASSVLSLPGVRDFTSFDLMDAQYVYNFQPISPEAFEFHDFGTDRPTMTNSSGFVVGPGDIVDWDYSANSPSGVAKRGSTDVAGWTGVFINNVNPHSSNEQSTYEVEYILHIEGFPRVQGISAPEPSRSTSSIDSILQYTRSAPNSFIQSTLETARAGLGHAANSLGRAGLNLLVRNLMKSNGAIARANYARIEL